MSNKKSLICLILDENDSKLKKLKLFSNAFMEEYCLRWV